MLIGTSAWALARPLARTSLLLLLVTLLAADNLGLGSCLPQHRSEEREIPGVHDSGKSSGPWALLVRHGEKDEDNPADIDLNQRGRIRAAAMAALLWPANATSRRLYTAPLPDCLRSSFPVVLAAQVPDAHKSVRRCLETAEYFQTQAQFRVPGLKIAGFGINEVDKAVDFIWQHAGASMGQQDSISVTVWDHTYMHELVNGVFNSTESPKWPGDRYDVWWLLDLNKRDLWQYSHEMLFGDAKASSPLRLMHKV